MIAARRLTARQQDIIERLTVPGATQQSVADELGISAQTVKNHLALAYSRLGVRSIGQAVTAMRKRPPVS